MNLFICFVWKSLHCVDERACWFISKKCEIWVKSWWDSLRKTWQHVSPSCRAKGFVTVVSSDIISRLSLFGPLQALLPIERYDQRIKLCSAIYKKIPKWLSKFPSFHRVILELAELCRFLDIAQNTKFFWFEQFSIFLLWKLYLSLQEKI